MQEINCSGRYGYVEFLWQQDIWREAFDSLWHYHVGQMMWSWKRAHRGSKDIMGAASQEEGFAHFWVAVLRPRWLPCKNRQIIAKSSYANGLISTKFNLWNLYFTE